MAKRRGTAGSRLPMHSLPLSDPSKCPMLPRILSLAMWRGPGSHHDHGARGGRNPCSKRILAADGSALHSWGPFRRLKWLATADPSSYRDDAPYMMWFRRHLAAARMTGVAGYVPLREQVGHESTETDWVLRRCPPEPGQAATGRDRRGRVLPVAPSKATASYMRHHPSSPRVRRFVRHCSVVSGIVRGAAR